MCGIAGILEFSDRASSARDSVSKRVHGMLDALVHRGPDDWGIAEFDPGQIEGVNDHGHTRLVGSRDVNLVLGHRRLSILDLSSAGRQPMSTADGRFWIVLNGEIYNYVELREQLASLFGSTFSTGTDTEVLLEAYRQWGADSLGLLDGMFAFAIWDNDRRELFCARDRMGIKPFYFSIEGGEFVFASEPKAVLTGLGTSGHVDRSHLAEFLVLGLSDHDGGTFFDEVSQLRGGRWMKVRPDQGVAEERVFWCPPVDEVDHEGSTPGILSAELRVSVGRQLRSDVSVGSSLSGGLDSGAIVMMAAEILGDRAREYTALTLSNPGFVDDESELARTVAQGAGMRWEAVEPAIGYLPQQVEKMAASMGEPFSTLSMFAQYKIMERAGQLGLKVMLDGQGGDEVYLGYPRVAQRVVGEHLCEGRPREALRELRALSTNLSLSPLKTVAGNIFFSSARLATWRNTRRLAPFVDRDLLRQIRPGVIDAVYSAGSVRSVKLSELTSFCLPRLLRYEDRNSMAFGVEARVPHLANGVLDFALSLPLRWQVRSGWTKYALRKTMEGRLPDAVTWGRVKRGFDVPQGEWVSSARKQIESWLEGSAAGAVFDPDRIRSHLNNGAEGAPWMWRILSTALWSRQTGVSI